MNSSIVTRALAALRSPSALATNLLILALTGTARAQSCPTWDPLFGPPGIGGAVHAQAVWNDGTGDALYVAGDFAKIDGVAFNHIARWDGTSFQPLGAGLDGPVQALAVFDDGGGPKLFATGAFNQAGGLPVGRVARWDGASWSALGTGIAGFGWALQAWDDGGGPALYVGGDFATAGGVASRGVARWDGASWSALGPGVGGQVARVHALAVHDEGTGPRLFAGGTFATAGGIPVNHVARWDGSAWSALGSGVVVPSTFSAVRALRSYDDGGGPALYVGGGFTDAGGTGAQTIARWNGSSWGHVGAPGSIPGEVRSLRAFDDGGGTRLYAAGNFGPSPGNGIAAWDGSSWSALGSAVEEGWLDSLEVFDDGGGPALYAGGAFQIAGGLHSPSLARWSGAWSPAYAAASQGITGDAVHALLPWNDGGGPALYAAGRFEIAGSVFVANVARRDASGWSALGAGVGARNEVVHALCAHDDGGGSALYAAGEFTSAGGTPAANVARWDGTSWSPLGSGIGGPVYALASYDAGDGPRLYAGGDFGQAGGLPAARIARWDGSSWSAVGTSLGGTEVRALAVWDDGNGADLYAGGAITWPGAGVVRWDGSAWSAVATGISTNGVVDALHAGHDGLYVGGAFSSLNGGAGSVAVRSIARWTGSGFESTGFAPETIVPWIGAIASFDEGNGPRLVVTGSFAYADPLPSSSLARFDGSQWSGMGALDDLGGRALAVFDDGSGGGADLYVGGEFDSAGGVASPNLARRFGCAGPGNAFCSGDASVAPCPCSNHGAPGHGCDNSLATGGAKLAASGAASPDTLVLDAVGVMPSALSIFLQGSAAVGATGFGDGLRCVGGNLLRLYVANASGGRVSAPGQGDPAISARSAVLGDPLLPGDVRYYQVYYRDSDAGFCPAPQGSTFNASNALSIRW